MLMIIPCVIVYFLVAIIVMSLCNAAGRADKMVDYLNTIDMIYDRSPIGGRK